MTRKGVGERQTTMLGIDIGKNTIACTLLDNHRNVLWRETRQNSPDSIAALLDKVEATIPWILEPTGRYGQPLAKQAIAAGRAVRLASPRKAKAFLSCLQSRAKTDKLDSRGLALYGSACPLPAYPIKESAVETLDQFLSARKGIAKSIMRLQLQQQELPEAREVLSCAVSDLKRHLAVLDKQIEALTRSSPSLESVSRLDAVPGIGPVVAAAVASRLCAKSFSHPDSFVAYCGLDVGVRQSGKRSGNTGLTKQGDAELRRLLYLAAQANVRCKASPFKDQYERERAKGLSSTASLCAVARKLAKVCWSLHRHGGVYSAVRVSQQPVPEAKSKIVEEKSALPLDKEP